MSPRIFRELFSLRTPPLSQAWYFCGRRYPSQIARVRSRNISSFDSQNHASKVPKLESPGAAASRQNPGSTPPPRSPILTFIKAFFLTLIPVTPIVIIFREHVISTYPVGGPSMAPYLNPTYGVEDLSRETVLVRKLFWLKGKQQGKEGGVGDENWKDLHRGMVVMFRSPRDPEILAIKRIIGLPGDEVTPRSSLPYRSLSDHSYHLHHPQIVPYNHVWVEGDADDNSKSLDSNTYGPISMNLITGRVVAVIWPWERRRLLKWQLWDDPEHTSPSAEQPASEFERVTESGGSIGRSQRMRVKKSVISVGAPIAS